MLLQFGADLETCSLSWCPCSCRCCACLLFCQHEILICLWTPPGHLQIANVFRKELAIREYLSAGHWSYCFWNGRCSSYRIFCFVVFKQCLPFEVAGWRIPSWKQSSSGLTAHKARWLMRMAQVVVSFSGQAVSVSCVISNVYSAFLYAWGITECFKMLLSNSSDKQERSRKKHGGILESQKKGQGRRLVGCGEMGREQVVGAEGTEILRGRVGGKESWGNGWVKCTEERKVHAVHQPPVVTSAGVGRVVYWPFIKGFLKSVRTWIMLFHVKGKKQWTSKIKK